MRRKPVTDDVHWQQGTSRAGNLTYIPNDLKRYVSVNVEDAARHDNLPSAFHAPASSTQLYSAFRELCLLTDYRGSIRQILHWMDIIGAPACFLGSVTPVICIRTPSQPTANPYVLGWYHSQSG
jgi:hypothetical protein